MKNEFPSIESKNSKYGNILDKILVYTAFLLPCFAGSILSFLLARYDLSLLLAIVFVIILLWIYHNDKPVTYRMIVSKEGAEYYDEEDQLVDKVLYSELQAPFTTPKQQYDISIIFGTDDRITENITVWTKSQEGIPVQRRVYFHPAAVFFNLQKLNNARKIDINLTWNT